MEKYKFGNINFENKKNFYFTKYLKEKDNVNIIKYEENNGIIVLQQYDDKEKKLKIFKEENGEKKINHYDFSDKLKCSNYKSKEGIEKFSIYVEK